MKLLVDRSEALEFLKENVGEYFWAWSNNEHFQVHISQIPEVFYSTYDANVSYQEVAPISMIGWDKNFLWEDILPIHMERVQRPPTPVNMHRMQWVANTLAMVLRGCPDLSPYSLRTNCLALGIKPEELPSAIANATTHSTSFMGEHQ